MLNLILIVDNNAADAHLMEYLVQRCHPESEVITCTTAERAWVLCEETPPDLIVAEIHLPGADGYELCKEVRKKGSPCCDVPFMLVSSDKDKLMVLIDSLLTGAFSYESKPLSTQRFTDGIKRGLALSHAKRRINELEELKKEVFP